MITYDYIITILVL